ncbi:MAG: hypothetical protein L3J67_11885 [Hyphomicrobiaceae bacterium]|nr:hypothetical protein [Hyphomicrobiaceae bacterium]
MTDRDGFLYLLTIAIWLHTEKKWSFTYVSGKYDDRCEFTAQASVLGAKSNTCRKIWLQKQLERFFKTHCEVKRRTHYCPEKNL